MGGGRVSNFAEGKEGNLGWRNQPGQTLGVLRDRLGWIIRPLSRDDCKAPGCSVDTGETQPVRECSWDLWEGDKWEALVQAQQCEQHRAFCLNMAEVISLVHRMTTQSGLLGLDFRVDFKASGSSSPCLSFPIGTMKVWKR